MYIVAACFLFHQKGRILNYLSLKLLDTAETTEDYRLSKSIIRYFVSWYSMAKQAYKRRQQQLFVTRRETSKVVTSSHSSVIAVDDRPGHRGWWPRWCDVEKTPWTPGAQCRHRNYSKEVTLFAVVRNIIAPPPPLLAGRTAGVSYGEKGRLCVRSTNGVNG